MIIKDQHPRVLVMALGRINAADTANNGLLLRNLFGVWPKGQTAQIFSGGDNGDGGFFGHYYGLGPSDRRFGRLYYRLKADAQQPTLSEIDQATPRAPVKGRLRTWLRMTGRTLLFETGLFEVIFKVRLSTQMLAWLDEFRPQLIFAQGYTVGFTQLPLLVAAYCGVPIIYYPTDDWPTYTYTHSRFLLRLFSWLSRRAVLYESRRLVGCATVRLAFNKLMQEEYRTRYKKEFAVLMHGDDAARFDSIPFKPATDTEGYLIVCTGHFDQHRVPLLYDLDKACAILNANGLRVSARVFPVNDLHDEVLHRITLHHVHFSSCPSHADLVSVLRSADVLFLPERFGSDAKRIRLSVSSKAHLFMLSGKPILVYSDPVTGIARYATEEGWAEVVDRPDPLCLAQALQRLLTNTKYRQELIANARRVAIANHQLSTIQQSFYETLSSASSKEECRADDSDHTDYVLVRWGQCEKLFLPKVGGSLLAEGLSLHRAASLKGKVFRKLLASRVGFGIMTKSSIIQSREPERFCGLKWEEWMQCALHAIGIENGWGAFSFPQNTDKRCMALLIDKEQHSPCGFAKIALDEKTRKLFKNEADALKYLSCKGGLRTVSVPKLLHEGEYGQAYYFIQSVIPSQTRYLSDLGSMKWMSILNELANINRTSRPLSQYGWWQEFKRTEKPTRLLLPLLESEADKAIVVCSAHGDFGPGNILADGEHVWVFDWEGFDGEAPIMTDYFSYVLECFLQSRWRFVPNRLLAKRVLDYLWQNVEFADRKNVALALAYHSTKRGWTLNDDLCGCLCDDVLKRS